MATTTAPKQNVIGLKRKDNRAARASTAGKRFQRTLAKEQREIGNKCESAQQYYFHLVEKVRVLSQDDHLRKRRTTEERCCQGLRGWRILLLR